MDSPVARLFREKREQAGLSQATLARRAGVSNSTVLRLEGGDLKPLAETLFDLADVLQISYDDVRTAVAESGPDKRRTSEVAP